MIILRDNVKDSSVHAHRQSVCVFLELTSVLKLIDVSFKWEIERELILLLLFLEIKKWSQKLFLFLIYYINILPCNFHYFIDYKRYNWTNASYYLIISLFYWGKVQLFSTLWALYIGKYNKNNQNPK